MSEVSHSAARRRLHKTGLVLCLLLACMWLVAALYPLRFEGRYYAYSVALDKGGMALTLGTPELPMRREGWQVGPLRHEIVEDWGLALTNLSWPCTRYELSWARCTVTYVPLWLPLLGLLTVMCFFYLRRQPHTGDSRCKYCLDEVELVRRGACARCDHIVTTARVFTGFPLLILSFLVACSPTPEYAVQPAWIFLFLFFLAIPAALHWRFRRRKPLFTGVCRCCGYNLTGNVSGRCPECGTLLPAADGNKAV
jgi:hypothetical protein